MYKNLWYISNSYRSICATIAGPYQSPAFFPALLPISTNWWIPNGADGWSPNQNRSLRCLGSACLSCADSGLFFWPHLVAWSLNKDLSGVLGPRGEPKDGMGTPPARAGEWGLDTSKSTSASGWASGQVQPARQKRPELESNCIKDKLKKNWTRGQTSGHQMDEETLRQQHLPTAQHTTPATVCSPGGALQLWELFPVSQPNPWHEGQTKPLYFV